MSGWSGGEGIGDVSERFASAWANLERASAWFWLDLTAQKMLHVAFRGSRPLKQTKKKNKSCILSSYIDVKVELSGFAPTPLSILNLKSGAKI